MDSYAVIVRSQEDLDKLNFIISYKTMREHCPKDTEFVVYCYNNEFTAYDRIKDNWYKHTFEIEETQYGTKLWEILNA